MDKIQLEAELREKNGIIIGLVIGIAFVLLVFIIVLFIYPNCNRLKINK